MCLSNSETVISSIANNRLESALMKSDCERLEAKPVKSDHETLDSLGNRSSFGAIAIPSLQKLI